ncbi:RCC1 and BTB domain-containing protein 2 [Dermatophagoides pteronyssinus]|uniref:RCC1 and BTB domain-containing protein 2 n=1 Tax=Dermatophagoides pteronyssinus TaxID=6956 RepID=A0ABQ8IUL1_DERPT|nr:RCC1 and BTB domain-containing protein 2 [Dermatophagoides pteronyssinus]
MKKVPTDSYVDIELFQNDLKYIQPEFLRKIESIFKITTNSEEMGFLFLINDNIYAYGNDICEWLSLQHDPKQPKQIDMLNGKKITQIDSGSKFVVILTDDGQVYLAGGDIEWQTSNTLRLISNDNDRFEMIACGYYHLLLLRKDGMVFAIGYNQYGVLTIDEHSYDNLIDTGLINIKQIICGGFHNFAITNTNEIYSWGCNEYGQLGHCDRKQRKKPTKLVSFPDDSIHSPIKNIVAGLWHSLFLFENGQCFVCGQYQQRTSFNDYRQDSIIPIKIPIENVQNVACKNDLYYSLLMDQTLNYYEWGMKLKDKYLYSIKFCHQQQQQQPKSFAAASMKITGSSPITFGLTSTIYTFESHYPISFMELLDNPDNYDVEFIIGNKRILASKCYLRMVSKYYNRMFSGQWQENKQVTIKDYSYDAYYAYLMMLHDGYIQINRYNITELIDLANCYGDERLMKNCKTFIENDLNKQTFCNYLSLIQKYKLYDFNPIYMKLVKFITNETLEKITNNFVKKRDNIIKVIDWFCEENSFC